jgi:hypothetical protein
LKRGRKEREISKTKIYIDRREEGDKNKGRKTGQE